jgi:IS5 family transposase
LKIFNDLLLKFERSDWSKNPEMGLIDTILENHPQLYAGMAKDILEGSKQSEFGRKDTPTVEQIVRAAILKEFKGWTYRDLEYAQSDSRICATFIKLDERQPFCFQLWQKYISKVKPETLQEFLVALNRIAIAEGLEDLSAIRTDSTVVEANIHFPTNNALVWDCIKEAQRLLSKLADKEGISYRDYTQGAKSNHFKINNAKADKRVGLFKKQLALFTKSINEVDKFVKKKDFFSPDSIAIIKALEELLPLMQQVYSMSYRKEVLGQAVPNDEKIFSIYERHTDIIVKGGREVVFGHKINLTDSRSRLILDCQILRGNPNDSTLFAPVLEQIHSNYGLTPKSVATDGGYASKANQALAQQKGIVNIVFNKIVGSLKNIASSKSMETRLKKWRSGAEATVSNLKRGFNLFRCNWKGWEHYQAKVLWSVIAYNIRVMTGLVIEKLQRTA